LACSSEALAAVLRGGISNHVGPLKIRKPVTRHGRSKQGAMFGAESKKLAQRAGSDSLQIQASGDINVGVSEERVREIMLETSQEVLASYTREANSLIQDRIFKLDDRVIAALVRENRLQVFADPGFQRTYRRAQEGAATTERDADYDLLAALLIDRAERGSQRKIRAGIERSIEIVDRIDEEALRGLTVIQAVLQYRPNGGDIEAGIELMAEFFGQLLDGPLPTEPDWLDHLDVLDAVRVNSASEMRKFDDFWLTSHMPGYMAPGAPEGTVPETWTLGASQVPWMVAPHRFKPGYVRIDAPSKETFMKYFSMLDPDSAASLEREAEELFHLNEIDESCREPLIELARTFPALRETEALWNSMSGSVSITTVGRVLARANAERLDQTNMLPPLD
jgi:hypothetical protein